MFACNRSMIRNMSYLPINYSCKQQTNKYLYFNPQHGFNVITKYPTRISNISIVIVFVSIISFLAGYTFTNKK